MNKTYIRCMVLLVAFMGTTILGLLVNRDWLLITTLLMSGCLFLDGIKDDEIEVVLREED